MSIKIYHGSDKIIKKPQFGLGKTYNDYGQGFYCTYDIQMAKEWGVGYEQNGYTNCYEFDDEDLSILDLNSKEYCMLHWLGILLENRIFDMPSVLAAEAKVYIRENFHVDYENYDVIVGYRADDSYFSFAQDFINGTISYRQLCNAMHLGKLGLQYVLKSEKAFERISYLDYEIAKSNEWYVRKINRDKKARREYFDVERNKRVKGDIYITNILDEEMRWYDARLR